MKMTSSPGPATARSEVASAPNPPFVTQMFAAGKSIPVRLLTVSAIRLWEAGSFIL